MPARLIINADDFGLTPGVNRAVEKLYRASALSSATLMANGAAFRDAVECAARNPGLGVGCHVVLTDGVPVSDPVDIPSLLGPDGRSFRPTLGAFVQAALRGRLRAEEIVTETLAQIRRIQAAGITVTHLDTHKHAHLFPAVSGPLLQAAIQAGVHAVRSPFEQRWSLMLGHGSRLRRLQVRILRGLERNFESKLRKLGSIVATTDGSLGISATGHLDGTTLRLLLAQLPEGTWELVCHPGYNDADLDRVTTRLRTHREIEREALLKWVPEALSQADGPSLIHYGALAAEARR